MLMLSIIFQMLQESRQNVAELYVTSKQLATQVLKL
jgi:hypothetical protein